MIRRRTQRLAINHERWLVSYSDFITLLFAFFVVMYSISQVNEGKYRILSDDLLEAFGAPDRNKDPIQYGEISRGAVIESIKDSNQQQGPMDGDLFLPPEPEFVRLGRQIADHLLPLVDDGVHVEANEAWLEIELNANGLFESASANPSEEAVVIFEELAQHLKMHENHIRIAGFTDNVPISTPAFPSNWELSASRAASVVKLLVAEGVEPGRLAAVGFGEFNPIASNETLEGRLRNRRVVIRVEAVSPDRPFLDKTPELMDNISTIVGESQKKPIKSTTSERNDDRVFTEQQIQEFIGMESTEKKSSSEVVIEGVAVDNLNEGSQRVIHRVELESGGILFTSDPESIRNREKRPVKASEEK